MLKTIIMVEQSFGYGLKFMGYPINLDDLKIIQNVIYEGQPVYVSKLLFTKLSRLEKILIMEPLDLTNLPKEGFILTDEPLPDNFLNSCDEIIVFRKFRIYPNKQKFSIKSYPAYKEKPYNKENYNVNGIRVDVIYYKKKEVPTKCLISKSAIADIPRYMYHETPDSALDSGWRFFSGTEDDDYVNNPDNFEFVDMEDLNCYTDIIKDWIKDIPEGYSLDLTPLLDSNYRTKYFYIYNDKKVYYDEMIVPKYGSPVPLFNILTSEQKQLPHAQMVSDYPDEYIIEVKDLSFDEKCMIKDVNGNHIIQKLNREENE